MCEIGVFIVYLMTEYRVPNDGVMCFFSVPDDGMKALFSVPDDGGMRKLCIEWREFFGWNVALGYFVYQMKEC